MVIYNVFKLNRCLRIDGGDRKKFCVSRFYFPMKRQRLIAFQIRKTGKSKVQDIIALGIIQTGKNIGCPGIRFIFHLDDPLGIQRGNTQDHHDWQEKKYKYAANENHTE